MKKRMSRFKFWVEKFSFMLYFARKRCWHLFKHEWQLTYTELEEAHAKFEETNKKAIKRIMDSLTEEEKEDEIKRREAVKKLTEEAQKLGLDY